MKYTCAARVVIPNNLATVVYGGKECRKRPGEITISKVKPAR